MPYLQPTDKINDSWQAWPTSIGFMLARTLAYSLKLALISVI